tara:strand:- start:14221 stop:14577 length:357 start_codon:yes stop_codon:yes gene_type:complete
MTTPYSQGELELATTGSGAAGSVTTVLVQSISADHYPIVVFASIECDTATSYVEIAFRDPALNLYRMKRVTGVGTWSQTGMAQIPPVLGCDIVAIIEDSAGIEAGRVMCDGVIERKNG